MTKMEIKLKELEVDVLRLRLEIVRLEREPIGPYEAPWVPRRRIHYETVLCPGFVDPELAKLRVGGS